ncbi:Hypothetical protein NTJ_00305 [Nesidiocoris tenuis]|uniref:Uncharacterized protein n=1 Tax=Nesidiocoris tenuis TaxID=355587 RepID=A0ABN7A606_9HEMI|nr:Hypothetical protein NTJ_00305 [Nesidiocoris tenuis]
MKFQQLEEKEEMERTRKVQSSVNEWITSSCDAGEPRDRQGVGGGKVWLREPRWTDQLYYATLRRAKRGESTLKNVNPLTCTERSEKKIARSVATVGSRETKEINFAPLLGLKIFVGALPPTKLAIRQILF